MKKIITNRFVTKTLTNFKFVYINSSFMQKKKPNLFNKKKEIPVPLLFFIIIDLTLVIFLTNKPVLLILLYIAGIHLCFTKKIELIFKFYFKYITNLQVYILFIIPLIACFLGSHFHHNSIVMIHIIVC